MGPEVGAVEGSRTILLWSSTGAHGGPMALPGIQEVNRVPKYFFLHRLKWKVSCGLTLFSSFLYK